MFILNRFNLLNYVINNRGEPLSYLFTSDPPPGSSLTTTPAPGLGGIEMRGKGCLWIPRSIRKRGETLLWWGGGWGADPQRFVGLSRGLPGGKEI